MVRQRDFGNVRLIACVMPWLCTAGHSAEEDVARAILTDARKGNCITCHFIPIVGVPRDAFGNLGPSLAGVGARLTAAQIKARIVDPRTVTPDTVMPAYGSISGLYRVQRAYRGKPILTDAEIQAVVAYLSTLK